MKMKKLLGLATCVVLLLAGAAQADTLQLGSHYTPIHFTYGGAKYEGGGSFDLSKWNGAPLTFIYCVDLSHYISLNGVYGSATATSTGFVNGAFINNAGRVAWLLDNYGRGGNDYRAYALQAAIWHVIYGGTFDIGRGFNTNAEHLYDSMLADLGTKDGNISSYLWITPYTPLAGKNNWVQGQVAFVPEAGALLLFGTGLVGLVGYRRVRRMQ